MVSYFVNCPLHINKFSKNIFLLYNIILFLLSLKCKYLFLTHFFVINFFDIQYYNLRLLLCNVIERIVKKFYFFRLHSYLFSDIIIFDITNGYLRLL